MHAAPGEDPPNAVPPDAGALSPDARPSAPSGTDAIVAPRLLAPPEVPYPQGAEGDAIVVLRLTVGSDGAVEEAHALEGEEPFAGAAEAAARDFRFEPALRRGEPVRARIRFEVRFRRPAPPIESSPPSAPTAVPPPHPISPSSTPPAQPAPASDASRAAPIEVTVRGERAKPNSVSFDRAEVRQLPGAFGDPFRAIEALPGVTPIVSGIPFFYVRGAPPGNVGYFLDGIKVPYLYHVGLGPAVIHPGMVDKVDLYPGGYPAEFGRFAGGIVSADTTAPRSDFHGEGNVRLFDLGAMVETGFADGRGTALVAGRYSYTAALLSLIAKDVRLDYRDYEARISYDLTPKDRVTVFSFGSYDLVGQVQDGILDVLFGSEFYRLDTRYEHKFDARSQVRAAVTLGVDRTKIPGQPRNAYDDMLSARLEGTHGLSELTTLRWGADVSVDAYRADVQPYADPDDPDVQRFNGLFPPRDDVAIGAYGEVAFRWPGFEITPGLRADLFRSAGATAVGVDPRISSRIDLSEKVHVLHAFGLAHQPPSFLIPVPGLAIGNLQGGLQTSIQSSAGLEIDLPEATTATVTVFDNVFLDMTDTLGTRQPGQNDPFVDQRSLGSAIGAELYVRRKLTRRIGGFLSYTLSRSTRSVGPNHFPSAFDRTHVANAALSFDLGKNWRAGTRLVLYTGVPSVTSPSGLIPPSRDSNPPRDPLFYRIDLRLEKRWVYSSSFWLSFVAEMMNATLHKEILVGQEIGPVSIPSVGLEMGF